MKEIRHFSLADRLCIGADQALKTLLNHPEATNRAYPASEVADEPLTPEQTRHSAALMRINHSGEVCAQALYYGQGCVSRDQEIQDKLYQAALEEGDHLIWCQRRLIELGSHSSYLNPVWYLCSFLLGMTAGAMGDRWSLGFLAETEHQVVQHLDKHLQEMAPIDLRSKVILQKMQEDEACHRDEALRQGGGALPKPVQFLMRIFSSVMVKTTYWL